MPHVNFLKILYKEDLRFFFFFVQTLLFFITNLLLSLFYLRTIQWKDMDAEQFIRVSGYRHYLNIETLEFFQNHDFDNYLT